VIWTKDAAQKAAADASKAALAASGLLKQPIVTRIEAAQTFYPAERYHQDFAARNRAHYERYRRGCGRDDRLDQIWGKDARGGDPAH
jgi:peptide-methionine (S)-S-oxide reductase